MRLNTYKLTEHIKKIRLNTCKMRLNKYKLTEGE